MIQYGLRVMGPTRVHSDMDTSDSIWTTSDSVWTTSDGPMGPDRSVL